MELLAFWGVCGVLWLGVNLSTPVQRRQWMKSFWTVVLLAGAAGLAWEVLH